MRKLIALVFAFVALLATARAELSDAEMRQKLDQVFAVIHDPSSDETSARAATNMAWLLWSRGPTHEATDKLAEASAQMNTAAYEVAEKHLIELVETYPAFAEAWNRRATLYYMEGRYEDSLADIEKVLALEPRHFGALSGKGMCLSAQGKNALALRAMKEALAINPHMEGVRQSIQRLEKLNPDL